MKVVINKCFGGFSISHKIAIEMYKRENNLDKVYFYVSKDFGKYFEFIDEEHILFNENNNIINQSFCSMDIYLSDTYLGEKVDNKENLVFLLALVMNVERTNKMLIDYIEKLGSEKCSGQCADLKVIEIPDDIQYYIDECDGIESIHEVHRSWE